MLSFGLGLRDQSRVATREQGASSGLLVLFRGNTAPGCFGSTHRWCVAATIWQWLALVRQFAMLVLCIRARRNEFPVLFDVQRMIPWRGRKLLVVLESSVLTGETRWSSLVSWRALLVENARRTRSFAI